ncbi:hypothetical protein RRG08_011306 [Elysia crispata]|uniref:Anoctamin dimerisation domain-containing protein n=1 Tax=Elysia crispata TaxID=231223 RepID=A0AAE1CY82_9GAST|nr:hypothetical protein RRG08_011306 [Elysia crispata]
MEVEAGFISEKHHGVTNVILCVLNLFNMQLDCDVYNNVMSHMAELHQRLGLPPPKSSSSVVTLHTEEANSGPRQIGRVEPQPRPVAPSVDYDLDLAQQKLTRTSCRSAIADSDQIYFDEEVRDSITELDGSDDHLNTRLKKGDRKGLFFDDGRRVIDFILVYEELLEQKKSASAAEERIKKWRAKFIKNLHKVGVQTEEEALESEKKLITFIKLHAPWDVCCVYAEDLGVRAPLQVVPDNSVCF